MKEIAFVLGNGTSRQGIPVSALQQHGTVFACNAVYRDSTPDYLIAVDPKMIIEICNTEYPEHNTVWTNYNHQYDQLQRKQYLNFFQPSLGWSSGPTALKLACDLGYKQIYILGFDYAGLNDNGQSRLNNVFADTPNYKTSKDTATYYGNWVNQTNRVIHDNTDVEFTRVISPAVDFVPEQLKGVSNIKHLYKEDFQQIYKIT